MDTSVKVKTDTVYYNALPLVLLDPTDTLSIVDAPANATVHAYELSHSAHAVHGCLQLTAGNQSALPYSSTHHVHATATIFKAYPVAYVHVSPPFALYAASHNCSSAVLLDAVPMTDSVRVGGVAQLYHLETQAAVAVFQGTLPPWLAPVATALAALLYHLASACRAEGRTTVLFSASNASKHAVALCMVAGAVQAALELGGVDGDAVKLGTVATQVVVAALTMCMSASSWAVLQGSSSVKQCTKSLMAAAAAFLSTGNVAATSALVQPLLTSCRRAQGLPAAYLPSEGFQGNRHSNAITVQRP